MNEIQILGFIAGIITSGAMLPQLVKTWQTKKTEGLSIKMFVVYLVGFGTWITYGFIRGDVPIIATNIISVIITSALLWLKIKYGKNQP
jgi:MtN3 and saliva related transmembrane protein